MQRQYVQREEEGPDSAGLNRECSVWPDARCRGGAPTPDENPETRLKDRELLHLGAGTHGDLWPQVPHTGNGDPSSFPKDLLSSSVSVAIMEPAGFTCQAFAASGKDGKPPSIGPPRHHLPSPALWLQLKCHDEIHSFHVSLGAKLMDDLVAT